MTVSCGKKISKGGNDILKSNSVAFELQSVENKKTVLRNDLIKRASTASIEVAKNHIINELNNNYDLHQRLIDESIEAIEGVELK